MTAKAREISEGTILTENGPFVITLILKTSGSGQSGSVWNYEDAKSTTAGEAVFSGLYIKSSGSFYISASSSGFVTSQSITFTITNHVKEITTTPPSATSDLYTSITISYGLIGDDDNDFILSTTVSVSASPTTGILLTTSTSVPSGSVTLSSTTVGTYSFQIATTSSSIKSTAIPVEFLKPNIVLTLDSSPTLSSQLFTIKVDVNNNANNAILTGAAGFSVVFSMSCTASYTCSNSDAVLSPIVSSISIVSGKGSVSSIKILSSGRFTAQASYSTWTITPALTSDVTNLVKDISFSIPSSIYSYFDFTVTISLTGEDDYGFILSCLLTLSDNSSGGLQGILTSEAATSSRTFSDLYYSKSGSFTITATVSTYTKSDSTGIIITPSVIVIDLSPTVIFT